MATETIDRENGPMTKDRPHDATCGAKTRAGTPCQQVAGWGTNHVGSGRCKLHGGKSLRGIMATDQRAGLKYSKYMPSRLLDRYQDAISDPDILELKHEIALTDGRLADLLTRVDTGESGRIWQKLYKEWAELETAVMEKDQKKQRESIQLIGSLIKQGHNDYAAWREIQDTVDQRRKLVESERKRLVETQQFITAEQAMVLFAAMSAIIKQHVTDERTRRAISEEITTLIQ